MYVPSESSPPRRYASERPTAEILGIPFAAISRAEVIDDLRSMIADERSGYVVLANAHTLNIAAEDARYHDVIRGAAMVLRDGLGVELAARLTGQDLPENFVGTDFVPALLETLAPEGVRAFLFGSAPGVAARAAAELNRRCGRSVTVGYCDGYDEHAGAVDRIRAARPDVLLVGLGNPRQEIWIAEHLPLLDVPVAIGVGALFDFLSGRVPRAPLWMRRLRAEWIYRLWREPRRLAKRYLVGNPKFLWRALATRRRAR